MNSPKDSIHFLSSSLVTMATLFPMVKMSWLLPFYHGYKQYYAKSMASAGLGPLGMYQLTMGTAAQFWYTANVMGLLEFLLMCFVIQGMPWVWLLLKSIVSVTPEYL